MTSTGDATASTFAAASVSAARSRGRRRRRACGRSLTPTLFDELRWHKIASQWSDDEDLIFASSHGTPLDGRNMVREIFDPAVSRAKLPKMRFHDCRHTFASLLIAQGAHPKYISEQLGHASVQITMDRYSHLLDQSYSDESDKLETALFEPETASSLQAPAVQTVPQRAAAIVPAVTKVG